MRQLSSNKGEMKISYKWLKRYVNTDKTPEEISTILTDTGLEVEGLEKVESVKGGLKGVVVGEVTSCVPHENADKLKVTTVDVNNGEVLQIVCGAPNVAAGQKVVVATVGTTLYPSPEEAFKIKKSKIRGVESVGMLCAEDELGLGQSHDGILVLPEDTKVGMKASAYFNLEDDYLIEVGLTPNRSDAMGHTRVARDLIAYLNVHENAGLTLNMPSVESFKVDGNEKPVEVSVVDKDLCPRYTGLTISNVKVAPSPEWMQNALRVIGLSPINNIVDITNYVMHELGSPLHAFDLRSVDGNVVVKTAKEGDKFTTLDEEERSLSSDQLMITNGENNMCIAGVFGSLESGVKEDTTAIFLESAYFNPVSVRTTAKAHGLNTDSSFRFERGVDPNMTVYALQRAALLIKELAGGVFSSDITDLYPNPIDNLKVEFSYERCNRLIGTEIAEDKVDEILENLDIKILTKESGIAELEIPAYRVDVTREADVIEEVLRIFGFNNIPLPKKFNSSLSNRPKVDREKLQNTVAELLTSLGASEMMNNSLTQSAYIEKLGGEVLTAERNVSMLNPLSQDLDVMRQSLIFGALESIAHNQNRQNPDLKFYEFGKVYRKFDTEYNENARLIFALTGLKEKEQWNAGKAKVDFYTLKAHIEAVFTRLGLAGLLQQKELKKSILADGVQLNVLKFKVGEIGWITPKMKKHFGIKQEVFIADLDWDAIVDAMKMNKVKFSELPKTFAVRRDFSLLLNKDVTFAEIATLARKADKKMLKDINLFDVYEGDKLEEGKKSYAVSFTFQDVEKTLKDKQVDAVMEKIRALLEKDLKAELRS